MTRDLGHGVATSVGEQGENPPLVEAETSRAEHPLNLRRDASLDLSEELTQGAPGRGWAERGLSVAHGASSRVPFGGVTANAFIVNTVR